jgi:hypothetical protein
MHLQFGYIPLDIVIQILEYSGIIKYRYGKFMNQISNNDPRYTLLENISTFTPIFLYKYSTKPLHYIRDLGKYYVKLQIEDYEIKKYKYIFQKKREATDTSIITLYYHKLL